MLKLAKVTRDDVVYDLGCGDGRIPIAAARTYGARGVGIDIDPARIAESRANARAAGVEHLVEFRLGDALAADVSPATVVTLFLLPSSNVALRPMLQKQLKPGARIVSHAFGMGREWPADETDHFVSARGDEVTLYLWRIPQGRADERKKEEGRRKNETRRSGTGRGRRSPRSGPCNCGRTSERPW
jgi:SAM-dependent methyltransferase